MDRLVLRRGRDGTLGQWWVLDYKSTGQPHLQPLLRDQLLSYRAAVQQLHPGHRVRAAFLTALGTLIEIDAP
jgi:ATP-dependent helicase/nuclease subunit A